ncbi:MAG: hypothetical protein DLM53_10445 [Candidatus Eremiobacter antarcticus]|nr:MAG: hypothetical protein DLM53_10445 [Candidatus Eremiobacter sp. RRmetagenome_bin22]
MKSAPIASVRTTGVPGPHARAVIACAVALLFALALAACGPKHEQHRGYQAAVVPGVTRQKVEAVLGKPQQAGPFSLPTLSADVMTYPFGQVLLQHDRVVAVSINNDPDYRGPAGASVGMSEDQLKAAFAAHRGKRSGHRDSYVAIEKTNETPTRDIYDMTDHVMIELAAANANDPLAPFSVSQITIANSAGIRLLNAFTKARVNGLYPDVRVNNFVSEPWPSAR